MTFDELAAIVVGVEPDDLPELGRVHAALTELRDGEGLSSSARAMATDTVGRVESIILRECDNPQQTLDEVGQMIGSLQVLVEGDELGQTDEPAAKGEPAAEAESSQPEAAAPEPVAPETEPAGEAEADSAEPPNEAAQAARRAAEQLGFESDPELLADFIAESLDHIEMAEASLLSIESDPSDSESINAVFRAFHTIKGTSGFLGMTPVLELAHGAETLLDRARTQEITLTGGYADLALESSDTLKQMIQGLEQAVDGRMPPVPDNYVSLFVRLADPEANGIGAEAGEQAPVVPRVGDILVARDEVSREAVEAVAESKGDEPIGQALVREGQTTAQTAAQAIRTQKQMGGGDATVRVTTEKLDSMINMVGELVIAQAMISQHEHIVESKDQRLTRDVGHLSKITRELQSVALSLRMVPLRGLFQKMTRLVRDVSQKAGKQVHFVTDGEDTEVDRNMVEALGDPLVHMIRNSVDHGIESSEDRAMGDKPETGTVRLRAYHEAGSVVIELTDDGKGLDREKILAKAMDKGLISTDKDMSDSDVYKLIFAPGFSTAEKVTDISGRGVGMDVVRRNIESLRGRVEVESEPGEGSTFSIRVPLTLAIIDGMLVRVGEERYIFPTISIQQSFQPSDGAITTVAGRGEVVRFRDDLLPVVRLRELFGVADGQGHSDLSLLMVVEENGERAAVAVDDLLGQQQVVIKSLGDALGQMQGISGAAILGDGRVGLILDVTGLIALSRGELRGAA